MLFVQPRLCITLNLADNRPDRSPVRWIPVFLCLLLLKTIFIFKVSLECPSLRYPPFFLSSVC